MADIGIVVQDTGGDPVFISGLHITHVQPQGTNTDVFMNVSSSNKQVIIKVDLPFEEFLKVASGFKGVS